MDNMTRNKKILSSTNQKLIPLEDYKKDIETGEKQQPHHH